MEINERTPVAMVPLKYHNIKNLIFKQKLANCEVYTVLYF